MKNILFAVILLLMISGAYAQNKNGAKVSSVKATKNTYVKEDNDKLRYVSYRNLRQELMASPSSELYDTRAVIELLENKFISNLLKEIFGINKLKILPANENIILSPTFSKEGNVIDVAFLMPKELPVTANELELLETGLKKNLKVKVVKFEEGKKYTFYGIRIRVSKILDGTYPY